MSSANIGGTFFTLMSLDSNLQTMIGTFPNERIYPEDVPLEKAQTFPYITYKVVSVVPINTNGPEAQDPTAVGGPTSQRSPNDVVRVQVSCFATQYGDSVTMATWVRQAIDRKVGQGYTLGIGPDIQSIVFDGMFTSYEKDVKPKGVFHYALDFIVRTINIENSPAFQNINSMTFDGVDGWLDLGDEDTFSFGDGSTDSPFSLSAWIKPDAIANNTILMGKNSGTGTEEYEFRFGSGGSGNGLRFRLWDASASKYIQVRLDVTIPTGSWSHVVATYDGTGTATGIEIYVDGVIPFNTELTQAGYVAMENTAAPFSMGTLGGQGGMTFYDGKMDEVSMFDIELSAAQVFAIYNSGTPNTLNGHTGLIGWWRMGESGAYPIINDSSTNSNDATMTNMTSSDINTDPA